jgi:hypothetical protein
VRAGAVEAEEQVGRVALRVGFWAFAGHGVVYKLYRHLFLQLWYTSSLLDHASGRGQERLSDGRDIRRRQTSVDLEVGALHAVVSILTESLQYGALTVM